jgi:hypothetical protein
MHAIIAQRLCIEAYPSSPSTAYTVSNHESHMQHLSIPSIQHPADKGALFQQGTTVSVAYKYNSLMLRYA